MTYWSIIELSRRLEELLSSRPNGKNGGFCTVFILLPDSEAWRDVVSLLRKHCENDIRLSDMCNDDALPTASRICAQLKASKGTTLITPLGEIIRRRLYPELPSLLCKRSAKLGRLFVPLMACAEELRLQLTADSPCDVLELCGSEEPCDLKCYTPDLAPEDCPNVRELISELESDFPPQSANVTMTMPLRFAGRGVRIISSGYAALNELLFALEFVADENTLTDSQWRKLYSSLMDLLCDERTDALEAFARCNAMIIDEKSSSDNPLRLGAWLYRLSGLHAGKYMQYIMENINCYESLEEAVALAILSEFDNARALTHVLSPEQMSADEWLKLRSERGKILNNLHIHMLPHEYWQLLEHVTKRRKLLYSSLYTDDERAFCRRYLIDEYHLPAEQIKRRADIRIMYPELLAQLQ